MSFKTTFHEMQSD